MDRGRLLFSADRWCRRCPGAGHLAHPAQSRQTRACPFGTTISRCAAASSACTSAGADCRFGDVPLITTGPASTKTNTEIKRADAYGIRLGLEYCKVNAIPKRNPPAFVLSTSLTLDTRKMTEAREQGLPVVLCSDFLQARIGSSVRAWRYDT